jgi:hypothetical protein
MSTLFLPLLASVGAIVLFRTVGRLLLRVVPDDRQPPAWIRRLGGVVVLLACGAITFFAASARAPVGDPPRIGIIPVSEGDAVIVQRGSAVWVLRASTGALLLHVDRCGVLRGVLDDRWLYCARHGTGEALHDLSTGAEVARGPARVAWMARHTGAPITRVAWQDDTLVGFSSDGARHTVRSTAVPTWGPRGVWWARADSATDTRLVRTSHTPVGPTLVHAEIVGEALYRALVLVPDEEDDGTVRLAEWHANGTRGAMVAVDALPPLHGARMHATHHDGRWHVVLQSAAAGWAPAPWGRSRLASFTIDDSARILWHADLAVR